MNDDQPGELDLFEHAPCGYVVTDDHGVVVRANREFLRLVGRDAADVLGMRKLAGLMTVGGRIFFETHLLPILEHDGVVREVELDVVRSDGQRVPVLLNANAIGAGGSRAIRGVLIEARDRHRYEEDLRQAKRDAERATGEAAALAQTLQQTLIPPAPPHVPHLAIAAAYRPAGTGREVGGDFYDVFQVSEASWCVVLGDVSGKGIPAATVTTLVRYTVRSLAIEHPDPADLLQHLDAALRNHPTEHYCTLVVVRLDLVDGRWELRMSLAGHPPPLLREADGRVSEFGLPGSAVGLVDEPSYRTTTLTLDRQTLLLYTDGVTEARSRGGFFGDERLQDLLGRLPADPRTIIEDIAGTVIGFQDGHASDDIALVALSPG